ncbi:hypothetical protein MIND_00113400 [Mycena indigotica]|uniref:Uncharacterized protein n=1 Tax=Mycena indigotica TaxID=2126181 RepID=A0A8H6TEM1_9AGAR|nr:uncharacterized protein MIND_00113400 [Mycena indigotica]KAF7315966.1 hypothetical protein MIND_00113400 [Mycena indigotica]
MDHNAREKEREVKDLIRRSFSGSADRAGALRKKTLNKLIECTRTGHPTLKTLAAENIPKLLIEFPELEEDAINAVYDLCEDQTASVRKSGYGAITAVSKAAGKWVRRNTDVLLQLLQSDEKDEVVVVKKALLEHLDLDARVTLSVLCDQVMPPTPEMIDADELAMRARLRLLVLAFLEGDVMKAIVERRCTAEDALVETLFAVIPKLPAEEVKTVLEQLLLRLPSFKRQSSYANTLLQILVEATSSTFKHELKQRSSLVAARIYMDLVAHIVVQKALVSPIELLRFYLGNTVAKMTLHQLSPSDQVFVICNMAETLAVCEKDAKISRSSQYTPLRNQSVDASPNLFECLAKSDLTNTRTFNGSKALLEACQRRKITGWTVPSHFRTSLDLLRAKAEQDKKNEVQVLIRSITAPPSSSPQPIPSTNSQVQAGPSRPKGAPPPPVSLMRSRPLGTNSISSELRRNSSGSLMLNENKHSIAADSSPRPPKRMRTESDAPPSLLIRLGQANTNGRATADSTTTSVTSEVTGGFSIKGAARASFTGVPVRQPKNPAPSSLLDRITMQDGGGEGGKVAKNFRRW